VNPLDDDLARRLQAVGVDPRDVADAGEAWRRLHARFGRRATLVDRYALEAAHHGITPEKLDPELRARLTDEVLGAHFPGLEFVPGSERVTRDPVVVAEYDPDWRRRFERWRLRLAAPLGAVAVRIDHVGSTAVPGLAAKPVIDVQVSVRDVDDEAAYAPSIEHAGVALRMREPEHRYFRPAGDRPREVQVHVCQVGSRWERDHLLFRDYLRAHPATRDAYAAMKCQLAARYRDDRVAYTEAKTAFIVEAMVAAEAWAARSGWSSHGSDT
jgi:GrpB-like predicted nucleotidyltransferase (UPF0157 family)